MWIVLPSLLTTWRTKKHSGGQTLLICAMIATQDQQAGSADMSHKLSHVSRPPLVNVCNLLELGEAALGLEHERGKGEEVRRIWGECRRSKRQMDQAKVIINDEISMRFIYSLRSWRGRRSDPRVSITT